MTRPTFDVRLKGTTAILDERLHRDAYVPGPIYYNITEGPPVNRGVAQRFATTDARTYYSFSTWVYVSSTGPSRPYDKLRAYVWDASFNVLATSNEAYDADDLTKDVELLLNFTFPAVSAPSGFVALGVIRDGSPSYMGTWRLRRYSDKVSDSTLWQFRRVDLGWLQQSGQDLCHLSSRLETFDHDISSFVKEITTDLGKNDIGGAYKEGKASFTLNNTDGRFYPDNTSSPYYGHFNVGLPLEFKVLHNGLEYAGFKGNIVKVDPPFPIDKRDVFVDVADVFARLKSRKVSLGTQSGKTASDLVLLVLQQAGVTAYSIMPDPTALNTVTWNEQNALDLLKTIVEAGQHHHFVGPDGIYYFMSNQWTGSNQIVLDLDDPCVIVDDAKLRQDITNIANRVRVKYPTNLWYEEKNLGSIVRHGQRDFDLDNALVPSLPYAQGMASFILRLRGDSSGGIDVTLQDAMPDVLVVGIGDIITLAHAESELDTKYRVAGVTKRFRRAGISEAELRCEKYILPPPVVSYYDYEYTTTSDYLVTEGDTRLFRAQSFMVPTSGKLLQVELKVKVKWSGVSALNFACNLYATDVNQVPTGSPLSTATNIQRALDADGVFDSATRGNLLFQFPGTFQLVAGTRYAWRIDLTWNMVGSLVYHRTYGAGSNVYADGKPSSSLTGATWTAYDDREHWARIRIQQ